MTDTRKNLLALGLASVLLTSPALTGAQSLPPDPMAGGPGAMVGIDLSDEQRARMREIQRELFRQETALREKLYEEYGKLEELFDADKPDPKAVREAYDRIHALRRQKIEARLQAHNRMYDLLTEEQRKLWNAQRRLGRGMGRGMMGPGFGPWWLDE